MNGSYEVKVRNMMFGPGEWIEDIQCREPGQCSASIYVKNIERKSFSCIFLQGCVEWSVGNLMNARLSCVSDPNSSLPTSQLCVKN